MKAIFITWNITEGIFCVKIPVCRMCPDPAPPAADVAVTAYPAAARKRDLLVPEPGEDGIFCLRPDPAEGPVPDITDKKFR